jgi:hypothetical protein
MTLLEDNILGKVNQHISSEVNEDEAVEKVDADDGSDDSSSEDMFEVGLKLGPLSDDSEDEYEGESVASCIRVAVSCKDSTSSSSDDERYQDVQHDMTKLYNFAEPQGDDPVVVSSTLYPPTRYSSAYSYGHNNPDIHNGRFLVAIDVTEEGVYHTVMTVRHKHIVDCVIYRYDTGGNLGTEGHTKHDSNYYTKFMRYPVRSIQRRIIDEYDTLCYGFCINHFRHQFGDSSIEVLGAFKFCCGCGALAFNYTTKELFYKKIETFPVKVSRFVELDYMGSEYHDMMRGLSYSGIDLLVAKHKLDGDVPLPWTYYIN